MVFRPGYGFYSFIAALVGGILLAKGSYVGGAVLVVIALAISAARFIVERRGEDETFTLW